MMAKSLLHDDYHQTLQNQYAHLLKDDDFVMQLIRSISKYEQKNLLFSHIATEEEWQQLGQFRLKNYSHKKPYMLNEVNESGLDPYDRSGTVYAAWLDHEMIASIRLCSSPFEADHLLSDDTLKNFLGEKYKEEYVEWTRLLIQSHQSIPGLLPALITYAGIKTLEKKRYHKYFGYSTLLVKRLFSRFLLSNESFIFTIPKRGNHAYTLLKGDFAFDFLNVLHHIKME